MSLLVPPARTGSRVRALSHLLRGVAALALALAAAAVSARPALAAVPGVAPALQVTGVRPAALGRDTVGARTRPVTSATFNATRAELTAALAAAERTAGSASGQARTRAQDEAAAIRRRLSAGDLRTGDRFTIAIGGDTTQREMVVREGSLVDFPAGIPQLSVAGVLQSELSDAVHAHLGRYLREPDVRVRPLVRLNVVGAVGRPGVYSAPADLPLAEVLMLAGGPAGNARTDRATALRRGNTLLDRKAFTRSVREGRTVQEAGLRSGDEIRLPERSQRNWTQIASYSFLAVSALTGVLALIRSSYQ